MPYQPYEEPPDTLLAWQEQSQQHKLHSFDEVDRPHPPYPVLTLDLLDPPAHNAAADSSETNLRQLAALNAEELRALVARLQFQVVITPAQQLAKLIADVDFIKENTRLLPHPPSAFPSPRNLRESVLAAFSATFTTTWAVLLALVLLWMHCDLFIMSQVWPINALFSTARIAAAACLLYYGTTPQKLQAAGKSVGAVMTSLWGLSSVLIESVPENFSIFPLGSLLKIGRLCLVCGMTGYAACIAWRLYTTTIEPIVGSWPLAIACRGALFAWHILQDFVLWPITRWNINVIMDNIAYRTLATYLGTPISELVHLIAELRDFILSIPTIFAWPKSYSKGLDAIVGKASLVGGGFVEGMYNLVPNAPQLPKFTFPIISLPAVMLPTGFVEGMYNLVPYAPQLPNFTFPALSNTSFHFPVISLPAVILPTIPMPNNSWYRWSLSSGGCANNTSTNCSAAPKTNLPTNHPTLSSLWSTESAPLPPTPAPFIKKAPSSPAAAIADEPASSAGTMYEYIFGK